LPLLLPAEKLALCPMTWGADRDSSANGR